MTEEIEQIALFRLQHIIPRSLKQSAFHKNKLMTVISNPPDLKPQEVEFQMTWGKIYAKIWGPENGRPVFAIPGWLDNVNTFDKLIPLLPKNLRIVAVDPPGHGLSDPFPPDIAYNFLYDPDGVLAIERLAKQLGWEKFSVIGHSLGVCPAFLHCGIFPGRIEKLICLDVIRPIPTITETIDKRLRKTIEVLLKQEEKIIEGAEKPMSFEKAIEKSVMGSFESLDEDASRILLQRGLKQVEEGSYIFRRDRRLLAAPLGFIPKQDLLHLARKITAEVLIIKYSEGPQFEPLDDFMEHIAALKTNSKNVRYVEVEGTHHAHLRHPERVSPFVSEFFNSF